MVPDHKKVFDSSFFIDSDPYEDRTIKRDIDRTFPDHEYVVVKMSFDLT